MRLFLEFHIEYKSNSLRRLSVRTSLKTIRVKVFNLHKKIYFEIRFFLWLNFENFWFWEWFFKIGRRLTPLNLTCFSTRLSSKVFFGFWFSNFIINSCQFKIKPEQSTASATNYRSVSLSKSYRKYLKVIYCIYHSNLFADIWIENY